MFDIASHLVPPFHLRPMVEVFVIAMVALTVCLAATRASEPNAGAGLAAGTMWEGRCVQGDRVFGIKVKIAKREGNDLWGEIALDFRDGRTGVLTFEGMIVGDQVSWITDKKRGDVTFPGLYVGTLKKNSLSGIWRVPSFGQRDTFALKRVD